LGTAVCAGDMNIFIVAYVSDFIARWLPLDVSCNARKPYLTSQVTLHTVSQRNST
jgi:hypothetical protein